MKEPFLFLRSNQMYRFGYHQTFDFLSVILSPLEKFFWLSVINEQHREYSAMTKLQVRLSVLSGPWNIVK